jgi:curved DNA-binding protein
VRLSRYLLCFERRFRVVYWKDVDSVRVILDPVWGTCNSAMVKHTINIMDYKDYYNILGIERSANSDDIRKAYRKLAMQYHPDRNPGDNQAEERFKEINEAYQVLNDPQKRAHYDRVGSAYSGWQQRGGQGGFDWGRYARGAPGGTRVEYGDLNDLFGSEGGGMFSEFFRTIFGGGMGAAGTQTSRAAPAYQQDVEISLQDAFNGRTVELQSDGKRKQVTIPPGVRTGSKVRVAGAGPNGMDLYLIVQVQEHPAFERKGNDLHTTAKVSAFTAILGGEAEVETITGKVKLSIPPGTQPEQVFRLAGRGMPHLKSANTKGDLFVRLKVEIPRYLSSEQRELLEEASKIKF